MKGINRLQKLSFVIVCLLIASACNNRTVYNKFQPIERKIWFQEEEYYFAFDIADNSVTYDISLQIRNNNDYPYQNLWILSNLQQPDRTIVRDTIECMLADDFGKWTGNGITLFQSHFPVRKNFHFPIVGQYIISFRHGMRDQTLEGIEDIGIFIDKSTD